MDDLKELEDQLASHASRVKEIGDEIRTLVESESTEAKARLDELQTEQKRITEAVANKLNVDMAKVYSNIAVHGNTSSASIPIALDECVEAGRINEGDLLLMASFGGGVTWGGVLMRW